MKASRWLPALIGLLALAAGGAWWRLVPVERELTVLVVLDNVRADHLSVCGYDRPTSPTLDAFAEAGAWVRCDAVSPGTWTLPSHASYFTGRELPDHGVHFAPTFFQRDGQKKPARAFALDPSVPTLAEVLSERGWDTALVSGNPLLTRGSKLSRGFREARGAPAFGKWYDEPLIDEVSAALDGLDPDKPGFLFVNIADAHIPWAPVPRGIDWVASTPRVVTAKGKGTPMNHMVAGELTDEQAEHYATLWTNAYDWALLRADRNVARLLDLLEQRGLGDARMIITSDHGEYLGEHDMVGHCCSTYNEDTIVPMLARGFDDRPPEGWFNALDVHRLILDGSWPDDPTPPRSAAVPSPSWEDRSDWFGRQTWVSSWEGDTKHFWVDGEHSTIDLSADPAETRRAPSEPHAPTQKFAEDLIESMKRRAEDRDLDEALQALGYIGD